MRYLFISGFVLLGHCFASAQGELRNWRFGTNVALDMLDTPPSFSSGSAMGAGESCISVSDAQGQLLFYGNGFTVYNALNEVMSNGDDLLYNSDWQQGVATCPWPGSASQHFIFHTGEDHILRWSVVDMSLDGGLGAVTTKNQELTTNVAEAMTIARHANGIDQWLVVRNYVANMFLVYPITAAGVGTLNETVIAGLSTEDFTGMVRFNVTHSWMAATLRGGFGNQAYLGLFPFDAETGTLGSGTLVPTTAPWGLEFSCSGRYLYLTHNDDIQIQQFDMFSGGAEAILSAPADVSVGYIGTYDMQIAPDRRIYFVWNDNWNRGARVLGAITHPDLAGMDCAVEDSVVVWTYPYASNSTCLPNFQQRIVEPTTDCSTPMGAGASSPISDAPRLTSTIVGDGTWVQWRSAKHGYALQVIDATGRCVASAVTYASDHWLDTRDLSCGAYVLRLSTADGNSAQGLRFVKP